MILTNPCSAVKLPIPRHQIMPLLHRVCCAANEFTSGKTSRIHFSLLSFWQSPCEVLLGNRDSRQLNSRKRIKPLHSNSSSFLCYHNTPSASFGTVGMQSRQMEEAYPRRARAARGRVNFHPPRLRVMEPRLLVSTGQQVPVGVENRRLGTRRSQIYADRIALHLSRPPSSRVAAYLCWGLGISTG